MSTSAPGSLIVTGSAWGIGLGVAQALYSAGAHLTLVDVDPLLEESTRELGSYVRIVGDVAHPDCAVHVVDAALSAHDAVNGLANVAGTVVNGTAATVDLDDYERCMTVNVTGPLRLIRAVAPHMVASGGGSIVNFASVVGLRGRQDGVAYTTAKAAVLGLTPAVAVDFGRLGVRCNAICAGAVDTPMLREFDSVNPGTMERLAKDNFTGRIGTPAEVADLCCYLLGDGSTFVNGADIAVDGGVLAAFGRPRPASWSPLGVSA